MGRKPKPTETKRRAGNPGRRPLNESEPTPATKAPPVPRGMTAEWKRAWKYLCKELRQMGLLASSDQAIMTMYCNSWSRYVEVMVWLNNQQFPAKYLSKSEKGQLYPSSMFVIESMLQKQLKVCLSELGLSATSRVSLHATPPKQQATGGKDRFFKQLKVVG